MCEASVANVADLEGVRSIFRSVCVLSFKKGVMTELLCEISGKTFRSITRALKFFLIHIVTLYKPQILELRT